MQYGLTAKHVLHNSQNILCNNEIIFQNQELHYKIPFVKGLSPLDFMSFLGDSTAIALPSHADDWAWNANPPSQKTKTKNKQQQQQQGKQKGKNTQEKQTNKTTTTTTTK